MACENIAWQTEVTGRATHTHTHTQLTQTNRESCILDGFILILFLIFDAGENGKTSEVWRFIISSFKMNDLLSDWTSLFIHLMAWRP